MQTDSVSNIHKIPRFNAAVLRERIQLDDVTGPRNSEAFQDSHSFLFDNRARLFAIFQRSPEEVDRFVALIQVSDASVWRTKGSFAQVSQSTAEPTPLLESCDSQSRSLVERKSQFLCCEQTREPYLSILQPTLRWTGRVLADRKNHQSLDSARIKAFRFSSHDVTEHCHCLTAKNPLSFVQREIFNLGRFQEVPRIFLVFLRGSASNGHIIKIWCVRFRFCRRTKTAISR